MKRLEGIVSESGIREAISDLEELSRESPVISVAAIHVLKNELESVGDDFGKRRVIFERSFTLPGGDRNRPGSGSWKRSLRRWGAWLSGGGAELFRDDCDRCFWERMVPSITAEFGALADPFMNTINEVIINYAEYSFKEWALWRRVSAQIFLTDGELAYGIVRPHGLRQRIFDPLALKEKKAETLRDMRRGWGHTLLMGRALFISFDHSPKRRGMMIVVGPDLPADS
ncbi:MAG: hypothetical protein GY769_20865 [bacterium]|nr:hypothetical protein [bacterium]